MIHELYTWAVLKIPISILILNEYSKKEGKKCVMRNKFFVGKFFFPFYSLEIILFEVCRTLNIISLLAQS
jgi:hypothetical protein